jgi:hypothetical protein
MKYMFILLLLFIISSTSAIAQTTEEKAAEIIAQYEARLELNEMKDRAKSLELPRTIRNAIESSVRAKDRALCVSLIEGLELKALISHILIDFEAKHYMYQIAI